MSYKILCHSFLWGISPKPWDVLNQDGCEIVKADMSQKITEERLIELLKGVDGAIADWARRRQTGFGVRHEGAGLWPLCETGRQSSFPANKNKMV
ncbi:MAG: hypothetical protein Q7J80_10320 [Anaerolineales bacterium]|nr:hypothetical protein [Anaerolineales bacterium]